MKIAVVRVRGLLRVSPDVRRTLQLLGLSKKNHCVVVEDSPSFRGMIERIKSHVTFGSVSDETLKVLEKCRKNKVFALKPPRGGFGRKGIKMPFSNGGALGDRGDKINDLLLRMV